MSIEAQCSATSRRKSYFPARHLSCHSSERPLQSKSSSPISPSSAEAISRRALGIASDRVCGKYSQISEVTRAASENFVSHKPPKRRVCSLAPRIQRCTNPTIQETCQASWSGSLEVEGLVRAVLEADIRALYCRFATEPTSARLIESLVNALKAGTAITNPGSRWRGFRRFR
jgi:hypothetical protein